MNPQEREKPVPTDRLSPNYASALNATASQAVAWWSVHEFVAPLLEQVEHWPMAGTPTWCELPADHPAKIAAVYDAAQHHILRVETGQTALAQASQAVSAATDWTAEGRARLQRSSAVASGAYIPREAS
jgi:hypothetical protein